MISVSESDEAAEAREQADVAELQAQRTRKEIERLLGKWVNHGAGLDEMLDPELEKPVSVNSTAPERSMKESGKRLRSFRTQDMIKEGLCSSVTNVEDKDAVDGHFTRE